MKRNSWIILASLLLGSCQRSVPVDRPPLQNSAFDRKLTRMLPFDTKLMGAREVYRNLGEVPIFDVRSWEEYEVSHLPTAVWMPYPDLNLHLLHSFASSDTIILYCTIGYRSDRMGEKLRKEGYSQVYNLYGSIFAWAERGLPLVDSNDRPTNRIHTFNKRWSKWMTNDSLRTQW